MASRTVNARVQVRRDSEYNYSTRDDFLPLKGELCLVDTNEGELKLKIGDGVTLFKNLDWWGGNGSACVILGYYFGGNFYEDQQHTILIEPNKYNLYIDVITTILYYYNEVQYVTLTEKVVDATDQVKGIMKLYTGIGSNTDGTMTQKAIRDNMLLKIKGESLQFSQPAETIN